MGRDNQAASNSHADVGQVMGGTRRRTRPLRWLVAFATAILVFQAAYVTPVMAEAPSESSVPAESHKPAASPEASAVPAEPSATAEAAPSRDQETFTAMHAETASPAGEAVDSLPPLPAGAVEVVAERDAYSRVYRDLTGKLSREIFADPIFYQPDADTAFVPIAVGFAPAAGDEKAVVSDRAPARVTVLPADDPRGFLALEDDGFRVAYRPLVAKGAGDAVARAAEPVIDGRRADLRELFPGVDARVFARAEGANAFLVLGEPPAEPRWTFLVDLPKGATLAADPGSGGVSILDAEGAVRMRVAAPWATDSTPDEHTGSGRTTTALHYELGEAEGTPTLTVVVDDTGWLAEAVYPVYVDPTTTIENTGTNTNGDTFANRGNQSTSVAACYGQQIPAPINTPEQAAAAALRLSSQAGAEVLEVVGGDVEHLSTSIVPPVGEAAANEPVWLVTVGVRTSASRGSGSKYLIRARDGLLLQEWRWAS